MTRIFLYLLALVSGFSAAEAARPVAAQPAELGAPAAFAAAVAATYAEAAQTSVIAQPLPSLRIVAVNHPLFVAPAYRAPTVSRSDRSRE